MKKRKKLGIYVHIPFCESKCGYCDFVSFRAKDDTKRRYTGRLIEEIRSFESIYDVRVEDYSVDSIFFGGGTPCTIGTDAITLILSTILEEFSLTGYDLSDIEISIETNPGEAERCTDFYRRLREAGFNRLSIGLQSVHDNELHALGRLHGFSDFYRSLYKAQESFDNINIDLMFGIPYQTEETWCDSLMKASESGVPHISCYSLQIEEGTRFFREGIDYMDEEKERKMYHMIPQVIGRRYKQYEISNFAYEGYCCIHNIKYWKRQEYIGFGMSAHSLLNGVRRANTRNLRKYMESFEFESEEYMCIKGEMSEYMFLSLRLSSGVSEEGFYSAFGRNIADVFGRELEKNMELGLIEKKGSFFLLTNKGIDLSNRVFCDFV